VYVNIKIKADYPVSYADAFCVASAHKSSPIRPDSGYRRYRAGINRRPYIKKQVDFPNAL